MAGQIGRSTDPSTAQNLVQVGGGDVASFRYNNPGAQYPSARAALFGQTGYGIIGGGHKIAYFPSPVNGAAANFDLLSRNYVGMKIGAAGTKWTGANGFGIPGEDPDDMLTAQMIDNPTRAIELLQEIAKREAGKKDNLTDDEWRQAHDMFKAGSANAYLDRSPEGRDTPVAVMGRPTGAGLVRRARAHIGEQYVNVVVPKNDANWHGPWDCAEFVSWLVYQEAKILYGCVDDNASPASADAYTGAWQRDVDKIGKRVSTEKAASTIGGILLRYPPAPGEMGHIAVCDGSGGTIEAASPSMGVIAGTVHGRSWDAGILIPGISYDSSGAVEIDPPDAIYAIDAPNMDKGVITRIQQALAAKGFASGDANGEFGVSLQAAVIRFQKAEGLIVDGEVGPETAGALGISLTGDSSAPSTPTDRSVSDPLRQLIPLILMLLSQEKSMGADSPKTGQILELILPLLLQSALTGKQLDVGQLLAAFAGGNPNAVVPAAPVNTVPAPAVQTPAQGAQPTTDLVALLVPVIYERLTGKAWPGTEKPADAPATPNAPMLSRPSVQLSAGALGIVTLLQALGTIGLPFNLSGGGLDPTHTGTLSTLIPIITGVIGATGGFGALGGIAAKIFGGLFGKN